jgi:hypothetical protein
MLEISRDVALLGKKLQECNTGDKQPLEPTCSVDGTIGLLYVSGDVAVITVI